MIEIDIRRDDDELSGCVTLPAGLTGVFKFGDNEIELTGGQRQEIRLANDCKVS
jgi:hypothetical protein